MITVWGRRNSLNVQKVMWALGELGLDYQRHDIAGSFGVTPEYLKLNYKGTVPTIQDGELTLWESNVCVRYLAQNYGNGTLYPAAAESAAMADQWMEFQTSTLMPAFFQIFLNMIRLPPEQANSKQQEAGVKACAKIFKEIDAYLSGKTYIAGDDFSMGDIPIGALLYRYFTLEIERPSLHNVEAWYQRLQERPAYAKHVMIPFGSNSEEWLVEEKRNASLQ